MDIRELFVKVEGIGEEQINHLTPYFALKFRLAPFFITQRRRERGEERRNRTLRVSASPREPAAVAPWPPGTIKRLTVEKKLIYVIIVT
jgi:hypothetical protein